MGRALGDSFGLSSTMVAADLHPISSRVPAPCAPCLALCRAAGRLAKGDIGQGHRMRSLTLHSAEARARRALEGLRADPIEAAVLLSVLSVAPDPIRALVWK